MTLPSLHQDIIAAINAWDPLHDPLSWTADFDDLARKVFYHQYTHNRVYRTLCDNRRISPHTLTSIDDIPAVPTDAFKYTRLFLNEDPAHTFKTSGTTTDARGQHHFRTLTVYRASLHPTFLRFLNPTRQKARFLLLAPSPRDLPESSLSFMLDELLQRWGTPESDHYVTLDAQNHWHIHADRLQSDLLDASRQSTPVFLMGTAFAFAEFFHRLTGNFQLPPESRVMETGGFKGRTRTLTRDELYHSFHTRLGIPASHAHSEYSMTELSSQTYTADASPRFFSPPWLKIQLADPLSLRPYSHTELQSAPDKPGLIRFLDLANVDSVLAIQTSDRGLLHPDGSLQLLGRAPDAELRGCSLTIEEIVNP